MLEAIGKVLANFCTHMWTIGVRFLNHLKKFAKRIATIIARKQRPSSALTSVEEGKEKDEKKKGMRRERTFV